MTGLDTVYIAFAGLGLGMLALAIIIIRQDRREKRHPPAEPTRAK